MVDARNPSIWEIEAGGSGVESHLLLDTEFKASESYPRLCLILSNCSMQSDLCTISFSILGYNHLRVLVYHHQDEIRQRIKLREGLFLLTSVSEIWFMVSWIHCFLTCE